MIKHKQVDRVSNVSIGDEFDTKALTLVSPEYSSLFSEVSSYTESIRVDENHLSRYRREIADLSRRVENTVNGIASKQELLAVKKTALDGLDLSSHKARVLKIKKSLMNIPDIARVEVDGCRIKVETLPLFTKVRTGDGARTAVRRCIGAFLVTFDTRTSYMQAENLTFNCNRNHWSVSGRDCCMGNWEPQYRDLLRQIDIVGLIKMGLMYLRSTQDSGAYVRANHWIAGRDNGYNKDEGTYRPDLKVDDAIVFCTNHRMGIVDAVHPDNSDYVRIRDWKSANNYNTRDWIDRRHMYKLSKVKYRVLPVDAMGWDTLIEDAKKKIKASSIDRVTDKIDALKDGCTNAEILALISKYGR